MRVVTRTEIVRPPVPAALIRSCPPAYKGPLRVTQDLITRGDHNEAALNTCAVQVAGIAKWNAP